MYVLYVILLTFCVHIYVQRVDTVLASAMDAILKDDKQGTCDSQKAVEEEVVVH